jgi:hypothetical protein
MNPHTLNKVCNFKHDRMINHLLLLILLSFERIRNELISDKSTF